MIFLSTEQSVLFFYASNEPKSVLARDLGDCRYLIGFSYQVRKTVYTKICIWRTSGIEPIGEMVRYKNMKCSYKRKKEYIKRMRNN
jgi:hypothetical protein